MKVENDRQKRKQMRKKYRLQSQGIEPYDEYQDDMLIFKDSDRESILSYFDVDQSRKDNLMLSKDQFKLNSNLIDTPTRLVNHSNEFLPKKKKINPLKLAKKDMTEILKNNFKNFKDLENFSDIEKS